MKLRIIGDVHGKLGQYVKIAEEADFSVCVGDVGFDYRYLKGFDTTKHKIVAGNHDNYTLSPSLKTYHEKYFLQTKNFLGDFGVHEFVGFDRPFFFVRGAWSIDKADRKEGINWWANEELTYMEAKSALNLYTRVKPDFVITHDAPLSVVAHIVDPKFAASYGFNDAVVKSRTGELLEQMFESHRPKNWFFGHHHRNLILDMKGTKFVCIKELNYVDIDSGSGFVEILHAGSE